MKRISRLARCTAFVAVWAMLLQGAVPMLAAWAAQRQGVPVAEVCEVHGVAMSKAPADKGGDGSAPSEHASRAGHCALLAMGAFAPPAPTALALAPAELAQGSSDEVDTSSPRRDESARWIARLHHGPPASA